MNNEEYKKAFEKVLKLTSTLSEENAKQTCFLALLAIELMGQKAVNFFGVVCDSYFKASKEAKAKVEGV